MNWACRDVFPKTEYGKLFNNWSGFTGKESVCWKVFIHFWESDLFHHSEDNHIIITCFLPLFNMHQWHFGLGVGLNQQFFACTHPFLHSCVCVSCFSHVRLSATPWTVACQAPLSVGFSRQEYWSGLSYPLAGDLPDLGTEPAICISYISYISRWVLYS